MSERAFRDLFRMEVRIPEDLLGEFRRMATSTRRVRELVERIDRWMFGKNGSLAKSIEMQGRGGRPWKPLSDEYFHYKMEHIGEPTSGETIPPRDIISTDIWVRTGKFLEFTQTKGKGRLKRIVVKPKAMFEGKPFYEVYVRKIDYWVFANEQRPIAFFTKEDKRGIGNIVKEWTEDILAVALGMRAATSG